MMGRPRKPDDERKKPFSISLTDKQVKEIKEQCQKDLSKCIHQAIEEWLQKRS